ncbi:carbohydrate-binding module family 20 domain-containing protein [uncultured Treponema sp.]|uniref:carbohydrate-binding module family 20 domain-containing protein n=1 Tax=uncultured Treponema sp. TaxID=162155 RepID=UPI0025CBC875|nr:carbohydrate-binding module family 20 domain-containing protein [uncultured Treponema sp.]
MKKLNKITAAFASLALAATALIGCVDTHDDLEYLNSAEKVWIIGSIDEFGAWTLNKAMALKEGEDSVFTGTFTAKNAGAEFKVIIDDNSNWDSAFWSGDTTPFYADTEVKCATVGGVSNCTVSLDIGVEYQITVNALDGSAPTVKFTAIGGKAATKLTINANGMATTMTNADGVYSSTVVAKSDSLLFSISDGTKVYGLKEADAKAFKSGTTYTLVEATEATEIAVTKNVGYDFISKIGADGVITLTVKDLKPIEIKSVPGGFNDWSIGTAAPTLVKEGTAESVYVYEWTQAADGDVEFKLVNGTTWDDTAYAGGTEISLGEDVVLASGGDNAKLQDLEADTKYALFITTTAAQVSVKLLSYTDMVITLPASWSSETTVPSIEGVIQWGGISAYWKETGKTWTTDKLENVPVTNGKIKVSVTSLSKPADWYNEQKGANNFKLGLVKADGDSLNYYSWFTIADEVTLPDTGI